MAAALHAAAEVGKGEIQPPATVQLRPCDLPIWRMLMRSRSRSEWKELDLQHAANLARCLVDIERLQAEVAREGVTSIDRRGRVIPNRKLAIVEVLSRRAVSLTKFLTLDPRVFASDLRDLAGRRIEEAQARQVVADADDDDLLAGPPSIQ